MIKVQGMNCNACKTIISMDLEENGLIKYIKDISLKENNAGEIETEDISDDIKNQIIQTIEQSGDYHVI